MGFLTLEQMVLAAAEAVRPPERIDVATAAERYHIIKTPGQHSGPFSLAKTPYLREPMEVLTSLDYTAMAFVGPARTGKSAMFINWLCHTAITDPSDMMLVHMSQNTARIWSQEDLARAIRNSEELAKRLRPGRQNDNVYDKKFLSGMSLEITWPTMNNLSGKTKRFCWIMDSDRIKPQIVEGEAHVFDATRKRTGTYKRFGMTGIEASPGFPVKNAKWIANPNEPHAAPPCDGILAIYNRGDRRRWFWQCLFCGDWFEPRFKLMRWPDSADHVEAAEQAHIACPHCFEHNKNPLTFDMLPELNGSGRWIKEGQQMVNNELVGTARRSDIASFWMFGPAAGLASDWKMLVLNYLRACEEYEKTGSDGNLMTTVTVDQGEAYVPPALQGGLLPDTLKARAEDWGGHDAEGDPYVPASLLTDGGFLISAIDVQAGGRPSFVVHTFAVSKGFDIWHVDMRKIVKSERRDELTDERHGIDPAAYPEDWDVIIKQVMERTYPLSDGSGRRMAVKMTVCDSGGKDGVTRNAYEFYRRLRSQGLHKRFHLVKGAPSKTETATIRHTLPDSQQKDRFSIARGDVPVWLINSNIVKDSADAKLRRGEPGGMIHFPTWAPNWLYTQLTTEIRMPEGWKNPNDRRNEAWDLLVYCIAACDHPDIQIRFLDWDNPPSWAAPLDRNDFVVKGDVQPFAVEFETAPARSLAELASALA